MKLIAFFALLSTAYADVSHLLGLSEPLPVGQISKAPILRNDLKINEDGSYSYYYETGNGIVGHEDGNPVLTPQSGSSVSGGYHYTAPGGKLIVIAYTADENGYHPSGDVVPSIPPIIQRSLDYNAAHSVKQI